MWALLILLQIDSSLMVLEYKQTATFVFVSPSLIKQTVIIISPLSASLVFFPSVVSFGGVVDHKGADFLDVKNTAIKEREHAASRRWKELITVMKQI